MKPTSTISLRKAAIIAGIGLLIMAVFAIFADSFVFKRLIVVGDEIATTNNILAEEILFRAAICSFVIVIVCDVVVAWAFYILFTPVSAGLSLIAAWFRLVYSVIFAVALFSYVDVLQLLSGYAYATGFEQSRLYSLVMLSINGFTDGWTIGFVFFGIHLVLIGYLIVQSSYFPSVLGVLMLIAGLAYLIDSFGKLLLSNYDLDLATLIGWGELLLMVWLLYKGKDILEAG